MALSLSELQASVKETERSNSNKQQSENLQKNQTSSSWISNMLDYKPYEYRVVGLDIYHEELGNDEGATNGTVRLLGAAVNNVYIFRDYDKMIQPVLQIKMSIPPLLKKFIINKKNEVRYRLRIDTIYTNEPSSSNPNGDNSEISNSFINGNFVSYTNDEDNFKGEEDYREASKNLGKLADNINNYSENVNIFLWAEGSVELLRKLVNNNYANTNVASVLVSILNENGISNVLMSPPENKTNYSQLLIPPTYIMNLTSFIDEKFGLYYGGTTFFYDFNKLYILNKGATKCDASEQGEYTKILINIPDSGSKSSSKIIGVADDSKNKEYVVYAKEENVDLSTPSKSNDIVNGGNMYIVNTQTATTTEISNANDSGGTYRLMNDNYGNTFNKGKQVSDVIENTLKLSLTIEEYDITIFTPNKEYIINFSKADMKKYSGTYRLNSEKVIMSKKGDKLRISGTFIFTWKSGNGAESGGSGSGGLSTPSMTGSVFAPNVGLSNIPTNISGLSNLGISVPDVGGILSQVSSMTSLSNVTPKLNSSKSKMSRSNNNYPTSADLEKIKYDEDGNILASKSPSGITNSLFQLNSNTDVIEETDLSSLSTGTYGKDKEPTAVTNFITPSKSPKSLSDLANKNTVKNSKVHI